MTCWGHLCVSICPSPIWVPPGGTGEIYEGTLEPWGALGFCSCRQTHGNTYAHRTLTWQCFMHSQWPRVSQLRACWEHREAPQWKTSFCWLRKSSTFQESHVRGAPPYHSAPVGWLCQPLYKSNVGITFGAIHSVPGG